MFSHSFAAGIVLCICQFSNYNVRAYLFYKPIHSSFPEARKNGYYELGSSLSSGKIENLDTYPESAKYRIDSNITRVYPPSKNGDVIERDLPDFSTLKPNDPLWLDMPWPSARSPVASAFAKHLQWKRGLSDGERVRWQRWAIYQRVMRKHNFEYSIEDYIFQNMLRDLDMNSLTAKTHTDRTIWNAISDGFRKEENDLVGATMKSYYAAFNRKNFDQIKGFWLPDDNVELILPGFTKVRGFDAVEKVIQRLINRESKPFGAIEANVVSIKTIGFVAVVTTIETIKMGSAFRVTKRKKGQLRPLPTKTATKKVIATTILRKYNKQWRIMTHHVGKFNTSAFTEDAKQFTNVATNAAARSDAIRRETLEMRKPNKALASGKSLSSATSIGKQSQSGGGASDSLSQIIKKRGGDAGDDYSRGQAINLDESRSQSSSSQLDSSPTYTFEMKDGRKVQVGDGSTTERMDFSSRSTQSDSSNRSSASTVPVDPGYDWSDDSIITEQALYAVPRDIIDTSASISKQTIQTIRFLCKTGRLPRSDKKLLIEDIIDNTVKSKISLVEIAFELLFVFDSQEGKDRIAPRKVPASPGSTRASPEAFSDRLALALDSLKSRLEEAQVVQSAGDSISTRSLRDFADQCDIIVKILKHRAGIVDCDDDRDNSDGYNDDSERNSGNVEFIDVNTSGNSSSSGAGMQTDKNIQVGEGNADVLIDDFHARPTVLNNDGSAKRLVRTRDSMRKDSVQDRDDYDESFRDDIEISALREEEERRKIVERKRRSTEE